MLKKLSAFGDQISTSLQHAGVRYDAVRFWSWHTRVRCLEPEVRLVPLLCKPGKSAIDIGMHTGMYLATAYPHSSAGIGFEPLPHIAGLMRKAFRRYDVQVHQVALSDRNGTTTIRVPRGKPTRSTISDSNPLADLDREVEAFEVEVRTLDSFELSEVGFLKIDTEGHEPEVLAGAAATLSQSRPAVLVEAEERHRQGVVLDVTRYLADFGYEGYFLRGGAIEPIERFNAEVDQAEDSATRCIRNFLFLQPEDARDFNARFK